MNANELAKMLFHFWNETEGVEIPETLLDDCAHMLRQQQTRIKELEDLFDRTLTSWAHDMEKRK